MLKAMHCLCEIALEITPVDPILIKSGYEAVDGTKMAFVTTNRNGRPEAFLPGSSLKGVFRSYFEKICRTLRPRDSVVCLPYKEFKAKSPEELEISCGSMFQRRRDSKDENSKHDVRNPDVYRYSCPACRMFGSTYFIGRCAVSDAYMQKHVEPEVRPGVAIDRLCGKVAQGPFDYQALTGAVFDATITIRNFELWMLGAWGYLLQDLQDRLIRIGAHKSRGMGTVEAKVKAMRLSYYQDPAAQARGLGELVTEAQAQEYGLHRFAGECARLDVKAENKGVRRVYDITPGYAGVLTQVAPAFNDYLDHLDWWQPLVNYVNEGR
jgi:CRISPR-associated RAMP protein (TIGR02581 family)